MTKPTLFDFKLARSKQVGLSILMPTRTFLIRVSFFFKMAQRFLKYGLTFCIVALPQASNSAEIQVTAGVAEEGNLTGPASVMPFLLSLAGPQGSDTSWEYVTVSDTARELTDYLPRRGQVIIPAGQTTATVNVALVGDDVTEDEESFALIVWPTGGLPALPLVEIPRPVSFPGFSWQNGEGGVSEEGWFFKNVVGSRSGSAWTMTRFFKDYSPIVSPSQISGPWLLWTKPFSTGVQAVSQIAYAGRSLPGPGAWADAGTLPLFDSPLVSMAGSIGAILTDARTITFVQMRKQDPAVVIGHYFLPDITIKPSHLAFSGNRFALAWANEVRVYESGDTSLKNWTLSATIPNAMGSLALEGDTLVTYTPSATSFLFQRKSFSRNVGGANQWGPVQNFGTAFPQLFLSSFAGNCALATDFSSARKIHFLTKQSATGLWTDEGSFDHPLIPRGSETYPVGLGGRHAFISSNKQSFEDEKAYGGSFAGATAVIHDDDLPVAHVSGAIGFEPVTATRMLEGAVSLSHECGIPVKVSWVTEDGTALAGLDYIAGSGDVIIPAGRAVGKFQIALLPDQIVEPTESFRVRITSLEGATANELVATWSIRDLNQPSLVIGSQTTSCFESAPPGTASVTLVPSGPSLTIQAQSMLPDFAQLGQSASEAQFAEPTLDFLPLSTNWTATQPTAFDIQLQGTDDNLTEINEQGSLAFKLPPDAEATSFSARLVDRPVNEGTAFYRFFEPTTDGRFAAAIRRKINGGTNLAQDIVFYERTAGSPPGWQSAGSLPASSMGITSQFGMTLSMRKGRLAVLEQSSKRLWILSRASSSGGSWELEASISDLPIPSVTAPQELPWAFDGESFVISTGGLLNYQIFSVNRGAGNWNVYQAMEFPTENRNTGSQFFTMDSGRLAYFRDGDLNPDVRFAERTGPANRPWNITETVPVVSGCTSLRLLDDLLLFGYGSQTDQGYSIATNLIRRQETGA